MQKILFICTGNYYRSRVAEILFNHFAKSRNVTASAISRGFRLNPEKNKGAISPHAVNYLSTLNIPWAIGHPTKLTDNDLSSVTKIIVLDEKEHRVMMRNAFPEWEDKSEFWNIADDYVESPSLVMPILNDKVSTLISTFS